MGLVEELWLENVHDSYIRRGSMDHWWRHFGTGERCKFGICLPPRSAIGSLYPTIQTDFLFLPDPGVLSFDRLQLHF